jgi:hypothetical protein
MCGLGDARKSFRTIMHDGAGTMSFAPARIEVKKASR